MLKEAIEKIEELRKPEFKEVDGEMYSDREFTKIKENRERPEPLQIGTLSGLVDYCSNKLDDAKSYIIKISSYYSVDVLGEYQENEADRNFYLKTTAPAFGFNFNTFYDMEMFNIHLQSQFEMNDNLEAVLVIAGGIDKEEKITHKDDGFTQNVVVKTGITKVEYADVPNPVQLRPLRTFPEIASPEALYVLRCRQGQHGPEFALFQADGGQWEYEAIQKISEYLKNLFSKADNIGENITIIA